MDIGNRSNVLHVSVRSYRHCYSAMSKASPKPEPELKDPQESSRESVQDKHPDEFPEGGLQGWLAVAGVWLSQFSTFGYINAYDYYVRVYMENKYSSFQLSWIGSLQLMLVLSSGLFAGRAFDTGYFYHLMIGGSVLFVFCLFMLSLTKPGQYYQVFLSQGLGMGLAAGMLYVPSVAVISHYFRRRRALAMGIATSGSGVGGAIHAIFLNKMVNGKVGFHGGVRASAGLNLGVLVIALLITRKRLPATPRKNRSILKSFRVFSKDPPYVLTVIATFLILSGLYFPIFFLQLSSIKNGINPNLAFYVITVLNGASMVGRILPNVFVRQVGVFNIIIPCVFACAICIFCIITVNNIATTMAFAIMYGIFSGAYVGIFGPMVSSLAKNDAEIGERLGICSTFTGFGGLIGSPITGALLSTSFIWWRPIVFSGLCVFGGGSILLVARFLLTRRKGTQFV
ncbi:major facilitator superfamily domain-containing protein [Mycena floridula]|nr:major facilitator superfamily domain-containing protein [Mycena floridula]